MKLACTVNHVVREVCKTLLVRNLGEDVYKRQASNSARDRLAELDILYNRARQAAITQEITEVIAGAKSQKKKRK